MKKQLLTVLIAFITLNVTAQNTDTLLLPGPTNWRLEQIKFPLDFALDLNYEGYEELRFSPGMFDTTSNYHFTYIFALCLNNSPQFKQPEIISFLETYFKGLCAAVAGENQSFDTSDIKVELKKTKKIQKKSKRYLAKATIFDAFTNDKKILLNMEIEIVRNKKTQQTYLIALASPQAKESEVWKQLHVIRAQSKRFPIKK